MKKFKVGIKFRYLDADDIESRYESKYVTVGTYDNLPEAVEAGNEAIDELVASGAKIKERLSVKHSLRAPNLSVADLCYTIFVTIDTLHSGSFADALREMNAANQRHMDLISKEQNL